MVFLGSLPCRHLELWCRLQGLPLILICPGTLAEIVCSAALSEIDKYSKHCTVVCQIEERDGRVLVGAVGSMLLRLESVQLRLCEGWRSSARVLKQICPVS